MVHQVDTRFDQKAHQLLCQLLDGYDETYGFGTMTCAVYDTAWVAMVTKVVDGQHQWCFPLSFQYLLDNQLPNGGWISYASEIDGILNTMAALLCLSKHADSPGQPGAKSAEAFALRIARATSHLQAQLEHWDVAATKHVGFEILVPTLLDLLEKEGFSFDFPGRPLLMSVRRKKMAKFNPAFLYGNERITALHSLEAFIGMIDFDRVGHHQVFGSMMASPSSTAAYLMHRSTWDEKAEDYLRHVIVAGHGKGHGGVPSAFPSTFFEITWVCMRHRIGCFSVC